MIFIKQKLKSVLDVFWEKDFLGLIYCSFRITTINNLGEIIRPCDKRSCFSRRIIVFLVRNLTLNKFIF